MSGKEVTMNNEANIAGLVSYIHDKHFTGAVDKCDTGEAVTAFLDDISSVEWYGIDGQEYCPSEPTEAEVAVAVGQFLIGYWQYSRQAV